MPLKGVAGVAVCPAAGTPLVAAYVPESKGSPGFIALYDYSAISTSGDAPAPLCRKSFYRVCGWGWWWWWVGCVVVGACVGYTREQGG